jgi:hypothetical protein
MVQAQNETNDNENEATRLHAELSGKITLQGQGHVNWFKN